MTFCNRCGTRLNDVTIDCTCYLADEIIREATNLKVKVANAFLVDNSETPKNLGSKYDGGKSPIARGVIAYFPRALHAVGMISKYGAEKYNVPYEDKNWERVENAQGRYRDALGRHLLYEEIDGPTDPESKQLHAAHAAWNALAYLEMVLREH